MQESVLIIRDSITECRPWNDDIVLESMLIIRDWTTEYCTRKEDIAIAIAIALESVLI